MVGSHLADFLIENTDWEVHGLCRWRSPLDNISQLVPRINAGDRVAMHYGDLRDTLAIEAVVSEVKPDYLFHLAAQSYPKTSFDSPLDTLETNIQGTVRVLESVKKFCPNCVTHVCSSSEVFGRVSQDRLPIKENELFHPASPYAISKVGTDLVGRYYSEAYGINIQTTRMFTHTGPRRGDVFAESSFAKQIAMIEQGVQTPTVRVGNLDSLRTIADVRDAVNAYYMLLTIDPVPGEFYNIGGEKVVTIREILECLVELSTAKSSIEIEVDKQRLRPIDADLQVPDTSKFRDKTGWSPQISFEKTMKDLLDYWRNRVADNPNGFLLR